MDAFGSCSLPRTPRHLPCSVLQSSWSPALYLIFICVFQILRNFKFSEDFWGLTLSFRISWASQFSLCFFYATLGLLQVTVPLSSLLITRGTCLPCVAEFQWRSEGQRGRLHCTVRNELKLYIKSHSFHMFLGHLRMSHWLFFSLSLSHVAGLLVLSVSICLPLDFSWFFCPYFLLSRPGLPNYFSSCRFLFFSSSGCVYWDTIKMTTLCKIYSFCWFDTFVYHKMITTNSISYHVHTII